MSRKSKYVLVLYMLLINCFKQKPSVEITEALLSVCMYVCMCICVYIYKERGERECPIFQWQQDKANGKQLYGRGDCQHSAAQAFPLALVQLWLMFRDWCLIQGKIVHSIIIPLHLHFVFHCFTKIKITVFQRFLYLPYNQDIITSLIELPNDL